MLSIIHFTHWGLEARVFRKMLHLYRRRITWSATTIFGLELSSLQLIDLTEFKIVHMGLQRMTYPTSYSPISPQTQRWNPIANGKCSDKLHFKPLKLNSHATSTESNHLHSPRIPVVTRPLRASFQDLQICRREVSCGTFPKHYNIDLFRSRVIHYLSHISS